LEATDPDRSHRYLILILADPNCAARLREKSPIPASLTPATPGQFLTSPGLWMGLAFAAACLAAAVRLRRYRGPV